MNDSQLDQKLKAAREPALPANYTEDFPRSVLASLSNQRASRLAPHTSPAWLPRLAWGFCAALLVAGAFVFGRWHAHTEVAKASVLENVRVVRETLALFPNQVRAIVDDGSGPKLVLADRAEVPSSPPLFVKICDGKNCATLVTFSGQEIQVGGQKFTVLAAGSGEVILEGKQFAWSSASRNASPGGLKISARTLSGWTM
jgi:hypothetical protein